ncbi:hypothetical protein PHMEG_00017088 [Phytophthora megakarya]|uniref:DDE-1 domain-containing protein n=1 Tax=Phytophthora megakarya TaxID=4795 RepID=A0A225VYX0_9STRA|nr:hypothetical protein PHMEG_00017088 [Phytophthora megakarya]
MTPHIRLFQALSHWVGQFMQRNDLSLRRRINFTTTISLVKRLKFNFAHTLQMDETAVYFEDAREHSVEDRGSRHVVVRSAGFASMRVTAVLAVTASGVKLPPLVILKDKKGSRKIIKQGRTYVVHQPKA